MQRLIRSSIPALAWPAALIGSVAVHAALFLSPSPQSLGDVPRPAGRPVAIAGTLAGVIGSASTAAPVDTAEPVKPAAAQVAEAVTPVRTVPVAPTPALSATASLAPVVEAQPVPETPADSATLAAPQPVKPAPRATKPPPTPDRTQQARKRERQGKKAKRRRKKDVARKSSRRGGRVQGAAGARSGGRGGARAASAGSVRSYGMVVRARILANRPGGTGGHGRAVISFGLSSSGGLRYASVTRSSGNRRLDALALRAVRRSAPFPRPPRGATTGQLRFSIAFSFN
ncbi:MAG: TonB family protein [Hyphomicrobiaceae bacterium]|nr:TonB family protein [Hyphomicrobiaceae bacterium]